MSEHPDTIAISLYGESHCDACGDIVHTHFDCPACKKPDAPTDLYGGIGDEEVGLVLACELCGARFEYTSPPRAPHWDWEFRPLA